MKVMKTTLPGVLLIEPKVFTDCRGSFVENYNLQAFKDAGLLYNFVQDNQSVSKHPGTIRGLHYQLPPHAQAKLIRVVTGAIYDVAIDVRQGSDTFGEWTSAILTADNHRQLLVPRGFAHGFCTLVAETTVMYKVDGSYSEQHERGVAWDDTDLSIPWPYSIPVLSEKDRQHPPLSKTEVFPVSGLSKNCADPAPATE